MNTKHIFLAVAVAFVAVPAMASHTNNSNRTQVGAGQLIGAAVGGFIGSQVGSGNGSKAATAIGVLVGWQVGQAIDQQRRQNQSLRYPTTNGWYQNNDTGRCEQYQWNSGAYAACLKGAARKAHVEQKMLEREAEEVGVGGYAPSYHSYGGGYSSGSYQRYHFE